MFHQRRFRSFVPYFSRKSPNIVSIWDEMLLTRVNLKALSDFTMVTVKFIRDFLSSFTFLSMGIFAENSVKLSMDFARKDRKTMPIIASVVQCLIGPNSMPSLRSRMNFSAFPLSLYMSNACSGYHMFGIHVY